MLGLSNCWLSHYTLVKLWHPGGKIKVMQINHRSTKVKDLKRSNRAARHDCMGEHSVCVCLQENACRRWMNRTLKCRGGGKCRAGQNEHHLGTWKGGDGGAKTKAPVLPGRGHHPRNIRHLRLYNPPSQMEGGLSGWPSLMQTLRPLLLFSYPHVASDHCQSSHRPLAAWQSAPLMGLAVYFLLPGSGLAGGNYG